MFITAQTPLALFHICLRAFVEDEHVERAFCTKFVLILLHARGVVCGVCRDIQFDDGARNLHQMLIGYTNLFLKRRRKGEQWEINNKYFVDTLQKRIVVLMPRYFCGESFFSSLSSHIYSGPQTLSAKTDKFQSKQENGPQIAVL